jgi:serine/threonine protein kinase/Tfp pilus assembly protein PilF
MSDFLQAPQRASLRLDALLDEQSASWRRGERLPVEDCLQRRPELAGQNELILDLIYHEIVLRIQLGETPTLDEYLRRFPQYSDPLRDQFDLHRALELCDEPRRTKIDFHPEPSPPPRVVGGYDILAELGRGGMGVVYKARRRGLHRLVALKMIHAGAQAEPLARFRAEAEALARLEHPSIIRIYDIGEQEGRPYLVMEFVGGGSLQDRLQGAPQPARPAAQLLAALAQAVHHAHQHGIVHRDLKPSNILLQDSNHRSTETPRREEEGQRKEIGSSSLLGVSVPLWFNSSPKISDFGLAKLLDAGPGRTRSGDILGTPSYMAPEQAAGRHDAVGPAADVYALGAILYEMLTGRPPFHGETVWDTLQQVAGQEPVPPRRLQPRTPRDLENICLKCLHKEPTRRYASARELADDLQRFLDGKSIRARAASPWERAWKWARRRPAAAAATATAAILLGVLLTAHYAHLRLELAAARANSAVAEAERWLDGVETEINAQNWDQAQLQLRDGLPDRLDAPAAAFPADVRLARLRTRAEHLDERIEQRLTDHNRLRRFRLLREDAAFLATRFAGLDSATTQRRLQESAAEALGLFDASLAEPSPLLDGPHFSAAEKDEIREGCCELLLETADASEEGRQRARAALAQLGAKSERVFELFLRGNALCQDGRLAEAARQFEKALAQQPDHFGAHYALAVCYLKWTSSEKDARRAHLLLACEHLEHCTRRRSDLVWPHLHRGLAHGELGDAAAAETDFAAAEQLLAAAPDDAAVYALHVNRGVSRLRARRLEGAVSDLTRAVRLQPTEYAAYVNLAQAYQEQGRWSDAVAQLDRAVALKPTPVLAAVFRRRARLYREQGRLEDARRDLEEAVRCEPNAAASAVGDWLGVGRLAMKEGQPAEALRAAEAALSTAPGDVEALRLRADALLALDRGAEALRALDDCLNAERSQRRGDASLYLARARARSAAADLAGAAEDYTRVLELTPDAAAVVVSRGWTYLALEAPGLALRDFDQAIRIDPAGSDAYNGRGFARARLGRCREAVEDAEKAVQLSPRQSRTLYNAARTLAQAAQRLEADPAEQTPSGRAERRRCQEKALVYLEEAVELLPAEERSSFCRHTLERDPALASLRRTAGYVKWLTAHADRVGRDRDTP